MSLCELGYREIAAILTVLLGAGCSSSSQSLPNPTPPPVTRTCHGNIVGGNGAHAMIAVRLSGPSTDVGLFASGGIGMVKNGHLEAAPLLFSLTPAHPSQRVVIEQPGYHKAFTVAFSNCEVSAPDVRFAPTDRGPRTTAIMSLP